MGKTLEPDVIRDQAAFLRLELPPKYHDFFNALCDMALEAYRPDSSGEAVREACLAVLNNYRLGLCQADMMAQFEIGHDFTPEQRSLYSSIQAMLDECHAAIRNLPLPTLPAASGWVSVGEQDIYEMGRFAKVPGTQLAALLGVIKSAGCAIVRLPAPPAAGDV